ncbi:MAG: hypothetical protein PF485_08430 [Bacteroidales bacterium]|jgi:hypothetical protein|nr:hypothetical protein [Bacteroidales bacterium]
MELNEVDIKWIQKFEKKCLRLAINGFLNDKNALAAVSKWREEFAHKLKSGEKANIICNCLEMTGYETSARKQWQQVISELNSQIGNVWIISNNKLFLAAANTMGFLSKFTIKTASSESEI